MGSRSGFSVLKNVAAGSPSEKPETAANPPRRCRQNRWSVERHGAQLLRDNRGRLISTMVGACAA
jgi:hypothetical protein